MFCRLTVFLGAIGALTFMTILSGILSIYLSLCPDGLLEGKL